MDEVERLGEALVDLAVAKPGGLCVNQGFYRAALLNYVGVVLLGRHAPAVRAFVASRASLVPGTFSPLWARGPQEVLPVTVDETPAALTLLDAVMADCFASSVLAYDDIHFATTTHPTGPVASAALGVARLVHTPLDRLVEALAVGMEVECRLALTMFSPEAGSASGWYTTGMVGGMGAAAAAGRLLGLDRAQMSSALGWAATAACGVRGTHGSAAGTFVPALATRAGLEAALFARDGLTCSLLALSGTNGLIRQVAKTPACPVATEGLGDVWVSREASAKPYPFGFVAFGAVEAASTLATSAGANNAIRSMEVFVSPRATQLGGNPAPLSADEAIVSIPYLVARTMLRPDSTSVPLDAGLSISDDERRLMGCISLQADASLGDAQARIVVNGGEREAFCDEAPGTKGRPMDASQIAEKFCSISGLANAHDFVRLIMEGHPTTA